MSEETSQEKSISSELTRLGKQVADAINVAWESEDRKRLQSEITTGLESFGGQVSDALRKASESDAATQVRDQTEKVVVQIRQSDLTGEVRKGLIAGLGILNTELGKLVERLEVEPQPAAPPAAESAGSDEPVTAPAEPPASTGEA
jgi:uncharacterized membrane protein YccC